ncbi:MAG: AcrB/AcrD/AcrF family protein [Bacteroidetes bacterium]|nr:MAG: AcrB/AcrD/AcrF family protein [Bacteroidota bacterium]
MQGNMKALKKAFSPTETILKRPVTVFMVSLIVVGFGFFSLSNLKITLLPSFNIPVLAVSVNYANVSPDDMSRLVVEPIEGAIMGVDGIESLEANVRGGGAFIILRMDPGVNIQQSEMKIREAIDRIRPNLPSEATDPVIFQFDPDRSPIMELSLESDAMGLDELRQLSIEFVEPRLERIPGVASADTEGGLERNFFVTLDPDAMAQHRITPGEVVSAIRTNNQNQPIGNLVAERISYSVRAESIYKSVEEIAATVVTQRNGIPIRVSDVARVENTYADIDALEEVNGKNSVKIEVQKQSDANTLDVANEVLLAMSTFGGQLPASVSFQVLSNEGRFIEDSVSNLAQSALIALGAVILILLLFMGGWRIALIVAMSIPVSLTATFAAMFFLDITLNIISIAGLALAIGLLVDNSIVVSESIANKLELGLSRWDAALVGTREVGGALLGSTLTTLGVFVPILAVSGFVGAVTRDLALTISIAITSSYVASIVLIPVLSSLLLAREQFKTRSVMFRLIHRMESNYGKVLFWLLDKKYLVAIAVVLIFGGSMFLFRSIESEFFPASDSGEYRVRATLPAGTQLYETAETLRGFSERLLALPEVRTVITSIGRQRWSRESNLGEMKVLLVDGGDRSKSTIEMVEESRTMLATQGVELDIEETGGGGFPGGRGGWGGGRGIQISLIGGDVDVLQELSVRIEEKLKEDRAIMSVTANRNRPSPELHFLPDRERITRLGTTTNQIANALGTQSRGTRAGFYREEGREIPILVRVDRDRYRTKEDLYSLDVVQVEDVRVPAIGTGDFQLAQGLSRLLRRDREVVLDLTVNVRGDLLEYREKIRTMIEDEFVMPDGYRFEFTGSTFDIEDSQRQLGLAFIFSLFLTYMVMASLFENLKDPLVIMFTVPLAFFGSLAFLYMTGTTLSVPAYIGIVILVGIVVNNGIVLVDYIHHSTGRRGVTRSREYLVAFLQACKRRMRPILLTALTTIFSMIPLALELGAGSETWSPLARSVIGGLTFATFLTLFVIPAIVVSMSKQRREWVAEALGELKGTPGSGGTAAEGHTQGGNT